MTEEVDQEEEVLACANCDMQFEEGDRGVDIGGDPFCLDCASECERCSALVQADEIEHIYHYEWGGYRNVCGNCIDTCPMCAYTIVKDDTRYCTDSSEYCCYRCSNECDNCGEYYSGERCGECRGSGEGIDGYGHTHPSRWFGGPVRAKGGYYIGIELEISASNEHYTGMPVHDWANNNGYAGLFECKEDSSVEGFEIVTQPMTPEFFESVNWGSFFKMINENYPLHRNIEPDSHGLHVHVGRAAFEFSDVETAAFAYLISQGDHLQRIGRREPTEYCRKTTKPVSSAITQAQRIDAYNRQRRRVAGTGYYSERGEVNLNNSATIEVRAFRSTRSANEYRNAGRVVYLAAEYVRSLRTTKMRGIDPKALHWSEFARWVGMHYPYGFASIAGIPMKGSNRRPDPTPDRGTPSYDELDRQEPQVERTSGFAAVDRLVVTTTQSGPEVPSPTLQRPVPWGTLLLEGTMPF